MQETKSQWWNRHCKGQLWRASSQYPPAESLPLGAVAIDWKWARTVPGNTSWTLLGTGKFNCGLAAKSCSMCFWSRVDSVWSWFWFGAQALHMICDTNAKPTGRTTEKCVTRTKLPSAPISPILFLLRWDGHLPVGQWRHIVAPTTSGAEDRHPHIAWRSESVGGAEGLSC
jgi:hypothetical protein